MTVGSTQGKNSSVLQHLATETDVTNSFYKFDGTVARKEGKTITGLYHLIKFAEKVNPGDVTSVSEGDKEKVRLHLENISKS